MAIAAAEINGDENCREWRMMATSTVSKLSPRFCMASRLSTSFPQLTQLDLSRASGVMDVDVERLQSLSNLSSLSLAKCRRVTDVAIMMLANSNPDLEVLNLTRCHSVTGTAFEALEVVIFLSVSPASSVITAV